MSAITDLYRGTPRQTYRNMKRALVSGLVPFVKSSPGVGKSSLYRKFAAEHNLEMIDHRLSTSAPEDLTGLPRFDEDGKARFAPFADLFPLEDTPLPPGKDGWLLFLDEANSATKSVQAACYKLVLDRKVGQHNLHSNVAIGMAGNLSTDKAIVTDLGTAMQSRVVTLEMMVDNQEWLEDVALKHDYDERILAYLNYKPQALMDFKPDHTEHTFCCPRTWEFMNALIKNETITDEDIQLFTGAISSGVAVDFVQFTKVYASMVSIDEVLRNPAMAAVPTDTASRWAVVMHLLLKTTDQNLDAVSAYIDRFDITFKIIYFRSLLVNNPEFRQLPAFGRRMVELAQYLS